MSADLEAITRRWSPAVNDFVSSDDAEPEQLLDLLTQAIDDIGELMRVARLLRDYGLSRIAIEQATRSAVEANDAPSELALANLRRLHEQCLDVLERVAVDLAGGNVNAITLEA